MAYVSRKDKAVVNVAPALEVNQPHSIEHGLVADKYKNHQSHADACYGNDNKILYVYLEETTRGSIFAASIKSYDRTQNGRGAWLALNTQYAGESK